MRQSMGSQGVGHDLVTGQQQQQEEAKAQKGKVTLQDHTGNQRSRIEIQFDSRASALNHSTGSPSTNVGCL